MGLPVVRTGDVALDRFLDAVRIYIDKNPSASGGGRGTDTVRYVRASDVQAVVNDAVRSSIRNMTRDELDGFAKSIAGTRLFSSLMGSGSALDGVVDGLPRTVLSDIRAAKSASTSAVSSTAIVSAEDNRAVAARLDTVNVGVTIDGQPVTATVEEAFLALVDKLTGAEAQYTVKLTTGGAIAGVAGFGLSLTSPVGAAPSSAFIIAADKFAVVSPSYSGGLTDTPDTAHVPFGVDASGVYINGQVRINAGGVKVEDGIHGPTKAVCFLRAATAPATPTGGSYASPTATGWSDGVPAGTLPLYMSTRIFTKDGAAPQQAVWTTPQLVSSLGHGAKVQFSVDGLTGWHDTPDADDVYMRSGVSTDGGGTWTYEGAVKIKGENGAPGTPGTAGARGSLTGYGANYGISSATWSDAQAQAVIYNMINGTTQTSNASSAHLRVGDTVTLSGPSFSATKFWGGSWLSPGVTIDGNLLVNGTIAGDKIATNSITADKIDSRGLSIKDASGNVVFASGTPLDVSNVSGLGTLATQNSVSYSGLTGTKPPFDATRNITTYSSTAPASPASGDIWVDTSAVPNTTKVYTSGAWQVAARNTTNTNQLTDGANLGGTATWGGVSSRPSNLQALVGTEDIKNSLISISETAGSISLSGGATGLVANVVTGNNKITSGNVGTYIASAAIGNAYIGELAASKITTGTLSADRIGTNAITADKIATNSINSGHIGTNTLSAVTINTSGALRATGSYTEGSFTFQGLDMKAGGVFTTTGGGVGYPGKWLVGGVGHIPSGIHNAVGKFGLLGAHYIASNSGAISGGRDLSGGVAGVTDTGSAVYGYASGDGSGLVGNAAGASGYSLKLAGSGRVLWGGLTIAPPPNNSTTFLRADGVWGAATGPQLMNLTSASVGAPSGTAYTLNVMANGTPFRILAYYP